MDALDMVENQSYEWKDIDVEQYLKEHHKRLMNETDRQMIRFHKS